jgi:hypothetical protein
MILAKDGTLRRPFARTYAPKPPRLKRPGATIDGRPAWLVHEERKSNQGELK